MDNDYLKRKTFHEEKKRPSSFSDIYLFKSMEIVVLRFLG